MTKAEAGSPGKRELAIFFLAASLLLGALAGIGFLPLTALPGLGLSAFSLLFLLAALGAARHRLARPLDGLMLTGAALLLILCYSLYDLEPMRALNAPVAAGLLLVDLARLTGLFMTPVTAPFALRQVLWLAGKGCVNQLGEAFRLLRPAAGGDGRRRRDLLLGLFLALPLLAVLALLLASADSVFQQSLRGIERLLDERTLADALGRLTLTVLVALPCLSLLHAYALGQPQEGREGAGLPLPALTLAVLLALVNLLYLAFAGVQFAYLFGGAQHAAMAGGWAAYARRGFFELTAIALINLGLCQYGLKHWSRHGLLRGLLGLLVLLTGLILASALKRMGLYIQAFGLSLLRLLTLWAMGVIALALLLHLIRLLRPAFRPFPPLLVLTLASYLALNLLSPAGLVAHHNVDVYLSGRLRQVDARYLSSLGSDSLPALQRLAQSGHAEGQEALEQLQAREPLPWYAWSLSEARLRNAPSASK